MKPYWTIPEACVWAATRDLEAVAVVGDNDPEAMHWLLSDVLPIGYAAHVLVWRFHDAGIEMPSPWEAFSQIPALCGDGQLTLFGVAQDDGDSQAIPAAAWAGLEISNSHAHGGFVAGIPLRPRWMRLRIRSADAQRTWPSIERPNGARRTAGAKLTKRESVKDYLLKTYPPHGYVPAAVKNESVAMAVGVHEKTVRRALIELGQNTDR